MDPSSELKLVFSRVYIKILANFMPHLKLNHQKLLENIKKQQLLQYFPIVFDGSALDVA
jgi:hypothetical protein